MRRCINYYKCNHNNLIKGRPDFLFCYIFECFDYKPIGIDNDWKPFMDNLNRSLKDWKYYFS